MQIHKKTEKFASVSVKFSIIAKMNNDLKSPMLTLKISGCTCLSKAT